MHLRILSPIRKAKRGGRGKPTQPRLEALNDKYSAIVSIDLQKGLKTFSGRVNYDKMANAVYSGNYKDVYATIPTQFLPADIEASMQRLGVSMEDASRIAAERIPFGRDVSDNYLLDSSKNPAIREYLDVKSAALVTNIDDNIQANIQETLRSGLQNRLSKEEIAERLKTAGFGINNVQAGALLRLEDGWRKSGLQETQIMQQIEEQAGRYLAQRCETIARTEVSQAQNAALIETWTAAEKDGLLGEQPMKTWITEGDPCPDCAVLSGDTIGLHDTWTTPEGEEVESAPLHVNCRCSVILA